MKIKLRLSAIPVFAILVALVVTGCGLVTRKPATQAPPEAYTQAAETIVVQLTQAASSAATTPEAAPQMPTPTMAPPPTEPLAPVPTEAPPAVTPLPPTAAPLTPTEVAPTQPAGQSGTLPTAIPLGGQSGTAPPSHRLHLSPHQSKSIPDNSASHSRSRAFLSQQPFHCGKLRRWSGRTFTQLLRHPTPFLAPGYIVGSPPLPPRETITDTYLFAGSILCPGLS